MGYVKLDAAKDADAVKLAAEIVEMQSDMESLIKEFNEEIGSMNKIYETNIIELIELMGKDRGQKWGVRAHRDKDGAVMYYYLHDVPEPPEQKQPPAPPQKRG